MSTDVLIRDLGEDVHTWLKDAVPEGLSQNEFLKGLITQLRSNSPQYSLFSGSVEPKMIYGQVPFKFIDLFAGIGGFRCGMTAAGGDCVFTNEWDKYAALTYQKWYGDSEIHTGDINQLDIAKEIPDHDVLCGGFPCQPFSLAGVSKKNSLGRSHGFDDAKQGNLFFRIMDIVDEKQPPVLLLENVKNLKSHDKGNTWGVIQQQLEHRNYAIYSNIIDASHRVPQHRERIFIVCFDKRIFGSKDEIGFEFPEPPEDSPKLSSILESESPDKKYMLSDKLWQYLQDYAQKHREKGNGFGFGLNSGKDVARTMSARYHKDGSEILIRQRGWKNPRRLTPKEAMKLLGYTSKYSEMFGFEDGFPQVVSDTQAYRQFGNSVVPAVVEEIGRNISECMASAISRTGSGCLLKSRVVT